MNQETISAPSSVESTKNKLIERYAALSLNNDHIAKLEEMFALSQEFRKIGMLDKAGEILAEAEALEKTDEFKQSMDNALTAIAGPDADTIRKYTAAAALENKN